MEETKNIFNSKWVIVLALAFATNEGFAKRIYIAPDDHTDYMWKGNEQQYENAFLEMTDYYLNRIDATQGEQSPYQARWNADGSFWMWTYQKKRTPAQFEKLIKRIKDGHFSVPLNPLVLANGGTPAEAILRGMYYPGSIQRAYNVDFPIAIAMENQTYPYGLTSLWAGSGAKYSWKGVCNCATRVPQLNNRDREIYYAGGRDGSRVLMKWNSNVGGSTSMGGYAEARNPSATINYVDTNAGFISRYPFSVIGAFGQGEDDLKTLNNAFITAAKQATKPNRQVIVSNQLDFFKDFETTHGQELETFAASYGNEWELYIASMAEVSARVKRATEKLRAAEAMATLVSLKDPHFMEDGVAARSKAMLDLGLYYEHNWTADGPISRAARATWQRKIEGEITTYVNNLHDEAKAALGQMIQKNGANQRFYVFNSLSWARTYHADFLVANTNPVHVVDLTTGQQVPSQYVTRNGSKFLRILASDVPSAGYKVFEIVSGAGNVFADAPKANGTVIENNIYKITVAGSGAITSLVDKRQGNRQYVKVINGKRINDFGGTGGAVTVENAGAVSATLVMTTKSPLSIVSRLTLTRNSDHIEIENNILQNFGQIVKVGYSFNLTTPDVWHEEVGAVIRAKLLANGGHYSPRNARYDWLTLNHFADMSGGGAGVTLSNGDAHFMQLGSSTPQNLDTATSQINVLVGGQVDGAKLGIPNQNGDSNFKQRFALQTHGAFNQTAAMKFALEHQNHLVVGAVTGTAPAYPEKNYSFLTISDPDVLLWALKPAEDGISQGIVTRVWNQANANKNYVLSLNPDIASAQRTTHIETAIEAANVLNGDLSATVQANQIMTHQLKL